MPYEAPAPLNNTALMQEYLRNRLAILAQPNGMATIAPAIGQAIASVGQGVEHGLERGYQKAGQDAQKRSVLQATQDYSDYLGMSPEDRKKPENADTVRRGISGALSLGMTPPKQEKSLEEMMAESYGKERGKNSADNDVPRPKKEETPFQQVVFEEKKREFETRRWDRWKGQIDLAMRSSRGLVGQSMQNNMRSRRAALVANDPKAIPQQLDAAFADYSSIMKGGTPDKNAMEHMRIETLKSKWANLKQYITSKPQSVDTPEVKEKLKSMLEDIVNVDNKAIKTWISYQEKANKDILKDPDRAEMWKGMQEDLFKLSNDTPGAGDEQTQSKETAYLKSIDL